MESASSALLLVAACVLVLVSLPALTRWLQRHAGRGSLDPHAASRLVSALPVGPQQRVVTVEVGPAHARTTLVLGVTQQSVTCLHAYPAEAGPQARPTAPRAAEPGAA